MPAFGFSVGDIIATVEVCRKLLQSLKTATGAAATCQRTLVELESLGRILHEIESLSTTDQDDDFRRVDSLRATALATTYPLRSFSQQLQRYEAALFPSATSRASRVKKAGRAMQWTMDMDEEVREFQIYISVQLSSINTLFQLLERNIASAREARRIMDHQSLTAQLTLQSTASASVGTKISSMHASQANQMQAIQNIARQNLHKGQTLMHLKHSILSAPQTSPSDAIILQDPLGRSFKLDYVNFQQWNLIYTFIRNQFSGSEIPGSPQVQAGDFFISRHGSSMALAQSNWTSSVYPGVVLDMTVVFTLMQLQLQQCPRPGCGTTVNGTLDSEAFLTCPKCQLSFRFDPDLKAMGLSREEDKIRLAQQDHDLDSFGRRRTPADVVEVLPDEENEHDSRTANASPAEMGKSTSSGTSYSSVTNSLDSWLDQSSDEACSDPGAIDTTSRPTRGQIHRQEQGSDMDPSYIAAWIDASAIPVTLGTAPEIPLDSSVQPTTRKQDEWEALKSLNRVHFVQKVPETRPLQDSVKKYGDMPLDAQICLRRVVDRFPSLPPYLAKRFANTNVKRAQRLRTANETLETPAFG